jgi:thiamine-phosphate pyrophosphorylase
VSDCGRGGSSIGLAARIRLIVLTTPSPACGNSLPSVVLECLEAGCRAVQLRDKNASGLELYEQAVELRGLTRPFGALLFVNDRLDVALAAGADGVHLGPDDIPVEVVRKHVRRTFLVGYSTDDPAIGRAAALAGADYLGVGAVYGTKSKIGLAEESVGPARVGELARATGLPCVGIGGITPENARGVAAEGAGVAVLSAVMDAECPGEVVARLLSAVTSATALGNV